MTATDTHVGTHDDHEHDHPSDAKYVAIAILLAVLTAIEILMFVFEDDLQDFMSGSVKIGLLVLMVIKFFFVGAYFMHLKMDKPILWQLFASGLVLAIGVYWIMLSAFEFSFWNDGYEDPGTWNGQYEFNERVQELDE